MSNIKRAQDFCAAWSERKVDAILSRMTKDCVYHNIPMPVMVGHDQIRPFLEPFMGGASSIEFKVHHIGEGPNGEVFTERTDIFVLGPKTVSIRVMGIFEFKDGLISAWRDYFDLAEFQSQMA